MRTYPATVVINQHTFEILDSPSGVYADNNNNYYIIKYQYNRTHFSLLCTIHAYVILE